MKRRDRRRSGITSVCGFVLCQSLLIGSALCADEVSPAQAPPAVSDSTPTETREVDRKIEVTTAYPTDEEITAGDLFRFDVTVRWLDVGEKISTRLADTPGLENLEIVSTSTRSSSSPADEARRMEEVYSFRLRALEQGPARIGSVEVIYSRDGEEERRLSTVPVDLDIGAPRRSPGLAIPILFGVVVFIAVWLLVWWLRRRRRAATQAAEPPQAGPQEEDLLAEARRWRMEGDVGRYYACLERAVGESLAKRYAYGTTVLRSASDLPQDVDSETRRAVESFFSKCVEAKYAPGRPTREELDRIWDDAGRLLRASGPQPEAEDATD